MTPNRISLFASLAVLLALVCQGQTASPAAQGSEGYKDFLKDLDSRIPQVDPTAVPKDTLREIKNAGDVFACETFFDIVGDVNSKRLNELMKFQVRSAHYTARASWREKIESVDYEKGIVVSSVTFSQLASQVLGAQTALKFGDWDTKGFAKYASDNRDAFLSKGYATAALAMSSPLWVVKGVGVALTWLLGKAEKELKKVDKDGYYVAEPDLVRKLLPDGANQAVGFVTKFEAWATGAEIKSTWEFGKGYTELSVNAPRASEEEKRLLAKMIYRTSQVSAGVVFPNSPTPRWDVNAAHLGGILMQGWDYDGLKGKITLRANPRKQVGAGIEDEQANTGKTSIEMVQVDIDPQAENLIEGQTWSSNKKETTSFRIKTEGRFTIVTDKDVASRYVRDAVLDRCEILMMRSTQAKGLLRDTGFDASARAKASFHQARLQSH